MASKDSDSATDTADPFFRNVFRLHDMPDAIITDRDPKFTSAFCQRLMELCDVRLRMSSSHHLQTEGSSEIRNRLIENYLRFYCSLNQETWDMFLTSAEFDFHMSQLEATGYTLIALDIG